MERLENCPDVLTPTEAAQVLRIGRSTMYRLIRDNEVRHIKIGKKILIPTEYIKDFLEMSSEKCYNSRQVENRPVAGKERNYDSNREP